MSAWGDLGPRVDRLVARLRPIGHDIGRASKDGDEVAQRVVASYTLLHRGVDPMALYLTEKALDEWLAKQPHQPWVEPAK